MAQETNEKESGEDGGTRSSASDCEEMSVGSGYMGGMNGVAARQGAFRFMESERRWVELWGGTRENKLDWDTAILDT